MRFQFQPGSFFFVKIGNMLTVIINSMVLVLVLVSSWLVDAGTEHYRLDSTLLDDRAKAIGTPNRRTIHHSICR